MYDPTDFPNPAMIPVNGVELEVFEAGKENAGGPNRALSWLAGTCPFPGVIRCPRLRPQAFMSLLQTSGGMAILRDQQT